MTYTCEVCGEKVLEKNCVFEGLDWCSECIDADARRIPTVGKTKHPCLGMDMTLFARPPLYATRKPLTASDKEEILRERKRGNKHGVREK
jgi:hypothetical protein